MRGNFKQTEGRRPPFFVFGGQQIDRIGSRANEKSPYAKADMIYLSRPAVSYELSHAECSWDDVTIVAFNADRQYVFTFIVLTCFQNILKIMSHQLCAYIHAAIETDMHHTRRKNTCGFFKTSVPVSHLFSQFRIPMLNNYFCTNVHLHKGFFRYTLTHSNLLIHKLIWMTFYFFKSQISLHYSVIPK